MTALKGTEQLERERIRSRLFEVVDQRAKLLAGDLSEERSDYKSRSSNGQGSQGKTTKSKPKAQKGPSNSATTSSDAIKEKSGSPAAPVEVTIPRDKLDLEAENDGSASTPTNQPKKEQEPTNPTSPLESQSSCTGKLYRKNTWDTFSPESNMIEANESSVGMEPNSNESPITKEASEVGAIMVSGVEMFIRQALDQFRLFTGGLAPDDFMRKLILENS